MRRHRVAPTHTRPSQAPPQGWALGLALPENAHPLQPSSVQRTLEHRRASGWLVWLDPIYTVADTERLTNGPACSF